MFTQIIQSIKVQYIVTIIVCTLLGCAAKGQNNPLVTVVGHVMDSDALITFHVSYWAESRKCFTISLL